MTKGFKRFGGDLWETKKDEISVNVTDCAKSEIGARLPPKATKRFVNTAEQNARSGKKESFTLCFLRALGESTH